MIFNFNENSCDVKIHKTAQIQLNINTKFPDKFLMMDTKSVEIFTLEIFKLYNNFSEHINLYL